MARIRYLALLSEKPERLAEFYSKYLGLRETAPPSGSNLTLSDGFFNFSFSQLLPDMAEARRERGFHHLGVQVESLDATLKRYREFSPRGVIIQEPGSPSGETVRILDPEGNPVLVSESAFGVSEETSQYPRMVHIALNAYLPQTVLDFYLDVFGFREVGQSHVWRNMGKMNRFAGDGHTNLAIHPFHVDEAGHESRFGINHIGFLTDDLDNRLKALDSVVSVAKRPDNRPYAEYRLRDPEGNMFDLSQRKGWEVDLEKWDMVA